MLTNTFVLKTLNRINKDGLIRQVVDIQEIMKKFKLKKIRDYDINVEASVKDTNNLFNRTNKSRERFKANSSIMSKSDLNINKLIMSKRSNHEDHRSTKILINS